MEIFSKRHYEKIAEEINIRVNIARERYIGNVTPVLEIEMFVYQLADMFQKDNTNFNREKFITEALKNDRY